MTSAKDPLNGTTTTALYFADLNKPMTEFFKTKILGDKENHRLCGKCGSGGEMLVSETPAFQSRA
jgi:hypothetical protein